MALGNECKNTRWYLRNAQNKCQNVTVDVVFLTRYWKVGRICLNKDQEKVFQVTKTHEQKSKKAEVHLEIVS